MPKKSELNTQELHDYYKSYQFRRATIVASILRLSIRNGRQISEGERAENDGKILELEADKARLDADHAAFNADQAAINPPSEAQLDALRDLIEQVDQLNADQRVLDEVIALSTDGLSTFRTILPIQNA